MSAMGDMRDYMRPSTSTSSNEQLWKTNTRKAQKEGQHRTVYMPGGTQYSGCWHNDKRHGKGVLTYKNGDKYEGDFAEGMRHGNGAMWRYRAGKYILEYEGGWGADKPHGHGFWSDGTGTSYDGEWQAGLRHGQGRAVYNGRVVDGFGGDVYEGGWVNDMREGRGTLVMVSGDIYEGHWHQDQKHGTGSYFYMSRGRRYDGIWDHDSPKCGSYSELQPTAPGSHGALPCLEVANAEGVLQAAVTAVAEEQDREAMMQM